jgi:hypothetical protein
MGGSDLPQKGPWKDLNLCNWVLGRATQGCRLVASKFQRGGSPVVRGKWGKRFRKSRGWPVLGKRGAEAASQRRTGAGGGTPRGGDGIPVAGGQESGGEVARQLPRDDVVLVVCLAGAERQRSGGMTARPRSGGTQAHRHCGPVDLVRESKIGQVCEHQWVAAVLLKHWIEGGRRQRRLSTASRSYVGAPARRRAREEGGEAEWACVSARVNPWEARGCASSQRGGSASESRCWQARRRAW